MLKNNSKGTKLKTMVNLRKVYSSIQLQKNQKTLQSNAIVAEEDTEEDAFRERDVEVVGPMQIDVCQIVHCNSNNYVLYGNFTKEKLYIYGNYSC